MGLHNQAIIYVAYISCGLFIFGVALMAYLAQKVTTWLTEKEYDQWIEDDIDKLDVQGRKERKIMEGKVRAIDKLKKKISDKEQGIESKTKESSDEEDKDEEDEDEEPMTAEEKHKADIQSILDLPTY